jgi:hypothetical protein
MTTALAQNYNYDYNGTLALALAKTTIIPSAYWPDIVKSQTPRIEAIASFAPKAKASNDKLKPLITAQDMISGLRASGLPISAIAEAMGVERKSIYSWLNGGDMRSANTQRATELHALFKGVAGVDVRGLYRFWNTPVDG